MIATVAELLDAFRHKEMQVLDKQRITHPPTIGSMYEGLARRLLEKVFPTGIDLRVVSGFITNDSGALSAQIDCMLVSGEGEPIPHTDDCIYHIRDVIAVVEVKKNLYSGDLASAYDNLVTVRELAQGGLPENNLFRDAFRSILRSDPSAYPDIRTLPVWKRQIGQTLYIESITPVRVVLGYHGFRSEVSFREAFLRYVEGNIGSARRFGPVSFPNLVICGGYSLIKLNGMPYSAPIVHNVRDVYNAAGLSSPPENLPIASDLWPFYASYASNPMVLLLELIWTRLAYDERLVIQGFGSDMDIELLRPLLLAKAVEEDDKTGWYYACFPLPRDILDRIPPTASWQPIELDDGQCVILKLLVDLENSGMTEGLSVDSPELVEAFSGAKFSLTDSIAYLHHVGLVSVEAGGLRLLPKRCGIVALPDGRVVAAEVGDERFTRWLADYEPSFKRSEE